jgi:hypothetical protein
MNERALNVFALRTFHETAREYSRRSGETITWHQVILAERRAFKKLREALATVTPFGEPRDADSARE